MVWIVEEARIYLLTDCPPPSVVLNVFTSLTELTAVARQGGAAVADGCMTEPRQNNKPPGVLEPCTAALFTTTDC